MQTTSDPTYELVIWDFDGTIADTRGAIIDAATNAMVSNGFPAPEADDITALVGLPIDTLYRGLAQDPGPVAVSGLTEAHRSYFEEHAASVTTVFAGIEDLLVDLGTTSTISAIATSRTQRTLMPLMRHLDIQGHFTSVRTDDTVDNPKPAPDMVLELCGEFGVDPRRSIVVGDTTFDIEMGRRGGALTCGVTWGNHGRTEMETAAADDVVDSVPELARLLLAG